MQCRHIGGDWGATSRRTTKVEEAPVIRTPTENARPSATEAASKMQTKRKEEEGRRGISAMDRSDQQRSNQNRKLTRSGDGQK